MEKGCAGGRVIQWCIDLLSRKFNA